MTTAICRPALARAPAAPLRLTDKQAIAFLTRLRPLELIVHHVQAARLSRGLTGILECAPPVTRNAREAWLAEVRRLLVQKYALKWREEAILMYAESLAETFFDGDEPEKPDAAIMEDFTAGL